MSVEKAETFRYFWTGECDHFPEVLGAGQLGITKILFGRVLAFQYLVKINFPFPNKTTIYPVLIQV